MQTRKSFFKKPVVIASLGCVLAFAAACGDDDDSNPSPGTGGTKATGGSGGSGGKGTAGKSSGAGAGNETSTPGGGGAGPTPTPEGGMGGGGDVGGAPPDCIDESDRSCVRIDVAGCKPKKALDEYLNACPTEGCEPFDNGNLSSLPRSGELPDLP